MNVWERNKRSWRKARKRAVSPIIATILLVAITVVLAAVLYVLISGLTHGPGNTPIGTAFAAGNPTAGNTLGSGAASSCATTSTTVAAALKTGEWVYTLTVESSTVTFAGLGMEVKAASGSVLATAGGVYVVNPAGLVVACATFAAGAGYATTSGYIYPTDVGATTTTSVTTLFSIVLDTGSSAATNPWTGQGNTYNGFGTGSYSGTTQAVTLP
jgi:archaeal type IV pilus assembly protein PilA